MMISKNREVLNRFPVIFDENELYQLIPKMFLPLILRSAVVTIPNQAIAKSDHIQSVIPFLFFI